MAQHFSPHDVSWSDHFEENGRLYGTFRRGCYMLPCDETEKRRMDMMHTMIMTIRERDRLLIHAPFREARPSITGERSRILDLGCGTGIWMLDMAEKYPDSEILGIDLNRMGPHHLLPNVDIRVPVDYESPWTLGEESWDLIHLQMGLGSVSSWPSLYRKIFRHLKPGSGWLELVEIDFMPRCDDGTLPRGKLTDWYWYIREAYAAGGRSIEFNPHTEQDLREAGFTDIQHSVYRLPLNGWVPEDFNKPQHRAGNWSSLVMSSNLTPHCCHGMEAMSLAPMTRVNRWSAADVRRLCAEAQDQALNPNIHAHNNLHIIIARRPPRHSHR